MTGLYHLAYISKSALGNHTKHLTWELEGILDAAKRNNPKLAVTGALLYSGGYFCQLLEGPKSALEQLFEKILADDRHSDVTVLFFDPAPGRQRIFGKWAMAFAGIEDHPRFNINGIRNSKDEIVTLDVGRNMIESLVTLVNERPPARQASAVH